MYGRENADAVARNGVAMRPPMTMSHVPASSAAAKAVLAIGTSCRRTWRSMASWWAISTSRPASSRRPLVKAYGGRSGT